MNELVKFLVEGNESLSLTESDEQALHEAAVALYAYELEEGTIDNLLNGWKAKYRAMAAAFKTDLDAGLREWNSAIKPEIISLINKYKDVKLDSISGSKWITRAFEWRSIFLLDDKYFNELLRDVKTGKSYGLKVNADLKARDFNAIFDNPKKVADFMKTVTKLDRNLKAIVAARNKNVSTRTIGIVANSAVAEACNSITRAIHSAR